MLYSVKMRSSLGATFLERSGLFLRIWWMRR